MTFYMFLAGVAALGGLVAAGDTSDAVSISLLRARAAEISEDPSDEGEVLSTKIDLDPEDVDNYHHIPSMELADLLRLEPQVCNYPEDGEGAGRLELSVGDTPGVTFRCPGGNEDELTPTDVTLAYRVDKNGNCDTTVPVDLDVVLPNSILDGAPVSPFGRGSVFLVISGRSLNSEKKACFVCNSKNGAKARQSCAVIVTVPKATLSSSGVCNPLLPAGGNMLTFEGDGPRKSITIHCPKGYSVLDTSDRGGYVMTGPLCRRRAMLEDVLGSGSTINRVEDEPHINGVSKSYRVTATSSFSKPRVLCLACEPDKNEQLSSSAPSKCVVEAFLPAATEEVPNENSVLSRTFSSLEGNFETTTSTVITSDGGVLSFASASILVFVVTGLTAAVM
ncbi:UNVERIFIED_CONTAM: SAG-related sequence SRS17A [Hammondia hammondi]|eukprot:XP_008885212.1 SAG-related sequence SRS17A [Hammondia hammondi]